MTLSTLARLWRVAGRAAGGSLGAREGYALWAGCYPPRAHNPLMEVEQSVVAPIIAAAAPRRALDVGTGTGRYLPLLAAAGARVIAGIDLSAAMLARNSQGRPCVCGDARQLPFADASFDLVCASLMAGDLPQIAPWVQEAARVLAPGGQLVYSDFHPSWTEHRWRRTFTTPDGRTHHLAFFPHSVEEHAAALEQAALVVRAIREPRGGGRRVPVVAVYHAVKPRPDAWRRR